MLSIARWQLLSHSSELDLWVLHRTSFVVVANLVHSLAEDVLKSQLYNLHFKPSPCSAVGPGGGP